jgi:uncharacterized protein YbaP (TraB family)
MRKAAVASLLVLSAPLGAAAALAQGAAQPAPAQPAPAQPAPAQPAPAPAAPPEDLGSPVVEALEVVAHPPRPAVWRVAKGDSEVVVLGAVKPLPHSLVWDTRQVDKALDGASVLLVEPKFKIGVLDMIRFKLGGGGVRQDRPLEDTLPEPLKQRFVAARTAAHRDAGRYGRLKPYVAAFLLVGDYREAAGLSDAKPDSTVEKLAKARGVPIRPVAEYRVSAAIQAVGSVSQAAGLACLRDGVDQVQREADRAQRVAKAWAVGDLHAVRAAYAPAPLERCLQQIPNVAVIERGTVDSTRAIAEALSRPGKAVAVVDLNFLLRPNGVLDRLKAQGAEVTVPPG